MTKAEIYLKSFIQDLEDELNSMQDTLINYQGRCDQLKIDINRVQFAIRQGKQSICEIEEENYNGKEETT